MKELLLGAMMQKLSQGVVVIDSDRNVVYANEKATGYTMASYPFYPCLRLKEVDIPCGERHWCRLCAFRERFGELLDDGKSFSDLTVSHVYRENGEEKTAWLLVSGVYIPYEGSGYGLLTMADITAIKQKEQSLIKEMELEPQTKTLNKTSFFNYISLLQKSGQSFILCMIDFDWFKRINDRYGHLMGDNVLRDFARISRENIKSGDVIGRYGGDEFVILFQEIGTDEAISRVSRIHSDIKEEFSAILPGLELSYSAGMVYVDENSEKDLIALVDRADRLMYEAKSRGKSRLMTTDGEYKFDIVC